MKKGSTIFLKLVIVCMFLVVLVLAGIVVPLQMVEQGIGQFFPFWILMYLTIIPFFMALYQGIKLLGFIDKNIAFSQSSADALGKIKFCAIAMTILYAACMPFVFRFADMDDAPGVILVWTAFCAAPLVIAVFAALLQMLLQNVIDIKSENDLTV